MPDDQKRKDDTWEVRDPDPASFALLSGFALQDRHNIESLLLAATAPRHMACLELSARLQRAGVSVDTIADLYIPAAARVLGEMWCSDERSFAEVTIGAARLQAMLRHLGPDWSEGAPTRPQTGTILLVVARGAYHTLGAMVLSGQLRRKGNSVRVILGASPADVGARLEMACYDAVFLSASRGERLESLRQIVEAVRQSRSPGTRVVVGGPILLDAPDAAALIGADFASMSPDEALEFCGLSEKTPQLVKTQRGH